MEALYPEEQGPHSPSRPSLVCNRNKERDVRQFTVPDSFLRSSIEAYPCFVTELRPRSFFMDRPYGISDFAFPNRWDRESGPDVVDRAGRGSDRHRDPSQPERETDRDSSRPRSAFDRSRTIHRGRNRDYSLRESEVRTLTDVGKFRVVPADDIARFGYNGNRAQIESDIRNLTRQGLIEQRTKSKGIRPIRRES
jgi:hypothetical protein